MDYPMPTLVLDFDGVIHDYREGWKNGEIYGQVTDGFIEWAAEAKKFFRLMVFSSRSDSHKGIQPMKDWLKLQIISNHWDRDGENKPRLDIDIADFEFPIRKPAAFVTIDDRALTFRGDWSRFDPKALRETFKPWNVEGGGK